jgi:hypothetical protein
MCWPNLDEEPAVMTFIPSDDTPEEREGENWARAREAKVGAGA